MGNVSRDFTKDEISEISLNDAVYDFSVEDSGTEKECILSIYDYLIIRNNTK